MDRVKHPVETYGVRLEHGDAVLAYSADTAVCDSLVRLAQGADLFLCEASYLDGEPNPRACTSPAGRPARWRPRPGWGGCC